MSHSTSRRIESEPLSSQDHEKQKSQKKGLQSDPFIFCGALGFIVVFVVVTLAFGTRSQQFFASVADGLVNNLNWFYIGGVSTAFLFLIGLFVSRFGNVRLGDDDEEPRYRLSTWFAMLFAGGMGATLMFWGVAEPLNHAVNPPRGDFAPMSPEAIEQAFGFTFYHFGIHMWVIMTLPGLALGYFIYKRKLPPRLSSVFAPILHGRIYSTPGKLIDILAIVGTTFGIAVSIGLGTLQINAGMNILWDVPLIGWVEMAIILAITVAGSISVGTGLDKGIKILSNINMGMAIALMVFILITGPTLKLLNFIVESVGIYAQWLPELMFWTDSFNDNPGWQGSWTVFYWAWSICWSPYVGMFIARISRGRTVREFIGGVLIVPTIFDLVWFAVFGRAGIDAEQDNPGRLTERVVHDGDVPFALFGLLDQYPLAGIVSAFALAVIVIFFITSIDSAALVNDMFATGEENQTPTYYRVGWAVAIGAVTAAIILVGQDTGIDTLQQVVVIVALPFFLIQFIMMYALAKGLVEDSAAQRRVSTRQWEKTDSAEKLEKHEQKSAPGYDENGDPLPANGMTYDEDGNLVIPGDVLIGGNLGVTGDWADRPEEERRDTRIIEQSRPVSSDDWGKR
ncbi:multidrug DMT transporter permease [Corynebacterium yudongzhengii]|uniref:BCCT family transporter n=1 Tax=Corynebacterium yudongzhengii TaxID=2080740 RepID=A0A2U1T5W8_9CORY|nr:BCCT family transporter [Corynebacterium yudongzhengii]AWB82639.1 multidrug DMT transporter permease [Corynebacterium yudongzhengii]PWC01397.1 BCCT family transporter [Corynebacterium yudongzhengii]